MPTGWNPVLPTRTVVLLAFLGCAVTLAGEESVLQWKWKPGQAFDVSLIQHIEADTSYTGKSIKLVVDLTLDLGWEVQSVAGDPPVACLRQSIRRIRAKLSEGQGGSKEYDSKARRNPVELSGAFDRFIDLTMTIDMDARGKIINVVLPAAAQEAIQNAAPQNIDFAQLLRQSSVVLPATGVTDGSTWKADLDTAIPAGRLKMVTTYLHAGEVDEQGVKLHKITHSSVLELDSGKDESKLNVKEHDQKGTVLFDAQAGRIASSKIVQRLKTQSRLRETVIDTTTRSSLDLTITPTPAP